MIIWDSCVIIWDSRDLPVKLGGPSYKEHMSMSLESSIIFIHVI